ncbi:MAG: ABC transporter permease, partial [Eggerthellaceae bacterium]|nr:ABC transporter permease [Eggerthellaceae bacterium]
RKGLIIWSAVVAAIVLFGILEYPAIGQYTSLVEQALAAIPRIGQIAFGVYNANLSDPVGYYVVMYYWTGLVVFTHAIYTGASIIAKESRDKTAEFLFTKPYKRATVVWAKMLAGLTNIAVVFAAAIVFSLVAMLPVTSDGAVYAQIAVSGIGMLLTQCVLMLLGLLCSALFKTYRHSLWAAIAVLVLSYALLFTVEYLEAPVLDFLSPLAYFGVADVVAHGLSPLYLGIAVVLAALCLALTQRLYARKTVVL